MIEFDWPLILKAANESSDTITVISTAAAALSQHLTDLQSAMKNIPAKIPARFDNWQTDLNTIRRDLEATQEQLQAIVRQAKAALEAAGA